MTNEFAAGLMVGVVATWLVQLSIVWVTISAERR